nr:MAG TPA: hypothetical protein [Caudoviricetes sp.]
MEKIKKIFSQKVLTKILRYDNINLFTKSEIKKEVIL